MHAYANIDEGDYRQTDRSAVCALFIAASIDAELQEKKKKINN